MTHLPDSFDPGRTVEGPKGQLAHPDAITHSEHLVNKLYKVGDKAWSLVGNGLSNQSFVEGPEGLIVIDTGECNEEMASALAEIRQVTDAPIVACLYTHFHYVGGTQTVLNEAPDIPIWGHAGIEANLKRFGGEVGPRGSRGLVHQFAIMMPEEGPDGVVNVGLGKFFRNSDHAPFTNGYVPASNTFTDPVVTSIAGLEVHFYPAPSDATDSATIWFPELKLAVNNLLWPTLFNVFAIRGEEYRDPRVLLKGLDQLAELGATNLIGAHGPPIEGGLLAAECIQGYRDSIQFLWDQTVRCANRGLTLNEAVLAVKLPDDFKKHFTTRQFYGVVEHHVRQIYTGLFGWFDEDEANLFPVPGPDRALKLIDGFGGIENVRTAIDKAMLQQDYRWAIELASWLVRSELNDKGRADGGESEDRLRLASALRGVAQSTTSANVRNWCITRALELDGSINLERFRQHRFSKHDLLTKPVAESLPLLRVLLIPEKAAKLRTEIAVKFDDETQAGLILRHSVAVPCSGDNASVVIETTQQAWAEVLGGKLNLTQAIADGSFKVSDADEVVAIMRCFDLQTLQA